MDLCERIQGCLIGGGWQRCCVHFQRNLLARVNRTSKPGGGKRRVNLREVVNALMYPLSTACQWRAIPKDLPPRSTGAITEGLHMRRPDQSGGIWDIRDHKIRKTATV